MWDRVKEAYTGFGTNLMLVFCLGHWHNEPTWQAEYRQETPLHAVSLS